MNQCLKNGFSARLSIGLLAVLLTLFGILPVANAQTIKLATIAPEGSSWMNSMRSGASEIKERTDGRVNFKFYGGGVQGNDKQVLRKMRIGQLHGGTFTSNTLSEFQKDASLYATPMLFNNLKEVKFVRNRLDDRLRERLEQAGYVNFGFASGGFAHIMSQRPIANLDDMQGLKVWVPEGDTVSHSALKALGVSPVTMPLTDVLTGLQTELIDTIMGPPAGTIILQWNTGVNYITDLPVAYIYAMLVVAKKYFDRIEPGDQHIVREVWERVYRGFNEEGDSDNKNAYKALLDNGMKSVTPNQEQIDDWRSAVRASNHKMAREGVMDISLLKEIECYISAYRSNNAETDCTQ